MSWMGMPSITPKGLVLLDANFMPERPLKYALNKKEAIGNGEILAA